MACRAGLGHPPDLGHRWPSWGRWSPVGGQPTHPEACGWPSGLQDFRLPQQGVRAGPLGRTPGEASPGVSSSGSPLSELLGLGLSWGHSAGLAYVPHPPPPTWAGGGFAQGLSPGFWLEVSLLVPGPLAFPSNRTGCGIQTSTHSLVRLSVIAEFRGAQSLARHREFQS